jgi:hypothetical protein
MSRTKRQPKPPFPEQSQEKPGLDANLQPKPRYQGEAYKPADKLKGRVALITGGDSGIGRAVAFLFAREGADVAIIYLPEEESDAKEIEAQIIKEGRKVLLISGDVTDPYFCHQAVEKTVKKFGKLDILVTTPLFNSIRRRSTTSALNNGT